MSLDAHPRTAQIQVYRANRPSATCLAVLNCMAMTELPVFASHGTVNAYINYGCRCEPCRETNSAFRSQQRALDPAKYTDYMREYMREYRAGKRRRSVDEGDRAIG